MTARHEELENTEPPATKVALKGNKLGYQIKGRGQYFPLSTIFGEETGGERERATDVYFRTEFNIYHLYPEDGKARLINANASTAIRDINQTDLSPEILEKQILTVGESFAYNAHDREITTTMILEIVATTNTTYNPDKLREITYGRSSAIVDDFEGRLPTTKPTPFPKAS